MKILVDGQTLATPESNRGIGVYLKHVLSSMMENDMFSEWFIAVSDERCLAQLKPWIKNRIRPIMRHEFNPDHITKEGYSYQKIYTGALQEEIKNKKIDVYWNPSPLMNNVMFPMGKLPCKMIVTIHDLIPMVFSDHYFKAWPEIVVSEYNNRLQMIGNNVDDVIFDSNSSLQDFNKYVTQSRPREHVIFLGVESRFQAKIVNNKQTNPYILYTGGFDYRKNMVNALRAFARLISLDKGNELSEDLKFVVVCNYSPEAKAEYEKLANTLGIGDRLILTGYISDIELQKLYRECEVFFFPSLYEGFGLPVLEAMVSGVPVVTSRVSSLPEVGADYAYYCDPENVDDMTETLLKALKYDDPGLLWGHWRNIGQYSFRIIARYFGVITFN